MRYMTFLVGTMILCFGLNAQNTLDITGVPVSATADSPVHAKEIALNQGQKEALKRLVQRLAPHVADDFPEITDDTILSVVQNISLSQEKNTDTQYMALLSVQFKPDATKAWMEQMGITNVGRMPQSLLMIPLLQTNDTVMMLEEENPLFQALKRGNYTSLYPIKYPLGDIEELQTFNPDIVYQGDFSALNTLPPKYGVQQMAILEATHEKDFYAINVKFYPPNGNDADISVVMRSQTETPELWDKMMQKLCERLDELWRQDNTAQGQEKRTLQMQIPIHSLAQWGDIKSRLEATTLIDSFDIQSLTKEQTTVAVNFQSSYQKLADTLERQNLILTQGDDGAWTLTLQDDAESVLQDSAPPVAEPVSLLLTEEDTYENKISDQ